jgi:hypothetical protein
LRGRAVGFCAVKFGEIELHFDAWPPTSAGSPEELLKLRGLRRAWAQLVIELFDQDWPVLF